MEETPALDRFYREDRDVAEVLVVALNDSPDSVRGALEKGDYEVPVLIDNGQIAAAYGISVVPTAVFIDREGRLANTKIGISTVGDLRALVASLGS